MQTLTNTTKSQTNTMSNESSQYQATTTYDSSKATPTSPSVRSKKASPPKLRSGIDDVTISREIPARSPDAPRIDLTI